MVGQETILTPQESRLAIKRYLQSEEFEVLQYQEQVLPTHSIKPTATYYSIIIKISFNNSNREVRFVAKRSDDPFQFQIKDAFVKEVFSHESLFKAFKDENEKFRLSFTPESFFKKTNSIILFEDLFDQGFVFPEDATTFDVDHIKLTLKTLAGYHAGSIAFEEKQSQKLGKRYRLTDEYEFPQTSIQILESTWFKLRLKVLDSLIDLLPQNILTHKEFKKGLIKLAKDSLKSLKDKSIFRNVLCHGYLWGNNMLFKYGSKNEPKECKLMNFELQHYSSPAQDVLQFIYSVTSKEMRKQHFHEFLQFYYDWLKHYLCLANMDADKLISLEDFELAIHTFLPTVKLQVASFRQIQMLKIESASSEDDISLIMESINSDGKFRASMMEAILELEDLILHPTLTMEDCFKIVANKIGTTNYELLNYELTPLSKISGYLGDHNKLKIDICINNERKTLKLFAKFLPKTNAAISIANDTAAFYKEIFMYQYFIPKIQSFGIDIIENCIVPCYFTRQNDVLIFDDFEILDYKTLEPRKPYTYECMQIVIKKMAKYHASSIILEEKLSKETGTKFRLNDHYPKELQESLILLAEDHQGAQCFKTGADMIEYELDLLSNLFSSTSLEDLKIKIRKAYQLVYELVKPSNEFRNVICHGDLWISNILVQHIDGVPTDSRFIDFQICRYCPPAHDLLTFMHLTTNQKIRKQHSDSLINLYYNELSTNLNKFGYDINEIYPYENFMKSIEYMIPQAVCQTAIYYQLALINSDILKEHMGDEKSSTNVLLGDRRSFIADMFERDPFFKERTLEALQDLEEMCLKYFP